MTERLYETDADLVAFDAEVTAERLAAELPPHGPPAPARESRPGAGVD